MGAPDVLEVLRSALNEVVAGAPNENIVQNHLNSIVECILVFKREI